MTMDKLVRVAIFIAHIKEISERSHLERIRLAYRAQRAIEAFIGDEVNKSQSVSKSDPSHCTWDQIGQALEISRSAAYTRYAKGRPR